MLCSALAIGRGTGGEVSQASWGLSNSGCTTASVKGHSKSDCWILGSGGRMDTTLGLWCGFFHPPSGNSVMLIAMCSDLVVTTSLTQWSVLQSAVLLVVSNTIPNRRQKLMGSRRGTSDDITCKVTIPQIPWIPMGTCAHLLNIAFPPTPVADAMVGGSSLGLSPNFNKCTHNLS